MGTNAFLGPGGVVGDLGGEVKPLIIPRVNPGSFPEVTPVSSHKFHVNLAVGVEQSLMIPTSANYAIFSGDQEFFVSYDEEVVDLPALDIGIFNTESEYSPRVRYIGKFYKLRMKSKYATYIHLSFYS